MTWKIIQGNVLETLATIEPGSVDCCVTSPPYWKQRKYLADDHPLKRFELGSEPTIAEYIANQVQVMRLVRTAMTDHAVAFVNIGDTYSGGGRGGGGRDSIGSENVSSPDSIDSGNLCLIPQRLMISLQEDGWFVRSVVIWAKPSPMPASLSGWRWQRCRVKVGGQKKQMESRSHGQIGDGNGKPRGVNPEWLAQWQDCPGCPKCEPTGGYVLRRGSWRPTSSYEPVIMLAKSAKYFADGEPVKTPPKSATVSRDQYTRVLDDTDEQFAVKHDHETNAAAGANLRDVWQMPLEDFSKDELIDMIRGMDNGNMPDVWTIASESLHEKHYAAFPTKLVMQCLKASVSEKGYCRTCGNPWVRMVESEFIKSQETNNNGKQIEVTRWDRDKWPRGTTDTKTIGWRPVCQCEDTTPRPGKVLDCYCGSGRTGVAARRLGLDFVGCELNPEYVEMAQRRIEGALRDHKRPPKEKKSGDLFASIGDPS